jgi:hypothetical protein
MNKTKLSTVKRIALATAMLVGCAAVAPAFAGHVSLNVGIGLPVVGVGYAPAPVVYAPPPPVYYAPAPVVYAPAPGYYGYGPAVGATVVVGGHPGYYHRGGYYNRGGYRYYGH